MIASIKKLNGEKSKALEYALIAHSHELRREIHRTDKTITDRELHFANYGHNCFEIPSHAFGHVRNAFEKGVINLNERRKQNITTSAYGHSSSQVFKIQSSKVEKWKQKRTLITAHICLA